jgi:hypothetical protein
VHQVEGEASGLEAGELLLVLEDHVVDAGSSVERVLPKETS